MHPFELGAGRAPRARAAAGRRAARRRRGPSSTAPTRAGRSGWPRPASCASKRAIGGDQEHAARLTTRRPLTTLGPGLRRYATLAAGEGAQSAVVPISRRRRPGRGVARPDRRRVARLARPRRAVAAHDRAPARPTPRGRLPRGRDQRARAGREPAARRRRLRGARPPAPAPHDLDAPPARERPHPPRRRAPTATALARRRRGRVRRVLAVRRARAARSDARDAARAHPRRADARRRPAATGCSAAPGRAGYVQRLAVAPARAGPRARPRAAHRRAALAARARRRAAPTSTRRTTTTRALALYLAPASRSCPSACASSAGSCDARTSRGSAPPRRRDRRCVVAGARPRAARAGDHDLGSTRAAARPSGVSLVQPEPWVALARDVHDAAAPRRPALAAEPGAAIAITHPPVDDVAQRLRRRHRERGPRRHALRSPNQIPVVVAAPDARRQRRRSTFGLSGSDVRPTIGINRPGVYPVEVELVNTGVAVGLVRDVARRRRHRRDRRRSTRSSSVAFVWQLVADPIDAARRRGRPDGRRADEARRPARPDRDAARPAPRASRSRSSSGPRRVEAWQRLARARPALARRVRARARGRRARRPPKSLPDAVRADRRGRRSTRPGSASTSPSEYAHGSRRAASRARREPADARAVRVRRPAPTTTPSSTGSGRCSSTGSRVRDRRSSPSTHPFTPAQAFVLDTTGGDSRGVATAPFVEDLLQRARPRARCRPQRVIAALAEVAYETPAIARGVVLAPPERLDSRPRDDEHRHRRAARRSRSCSPRRSTTCSRRSRTSSRTASTSSAGSCPRSPRPTPVDPDEYEATATELDGVPRRRRRDTTPSSSRGEHALLAALSTEHHARARARARSRTIDGAVARVHRRHHRRREAHHAHRRGAPRCR